MSTFRKKTTLWIGTIGVVAALSVGVRSLLAGEDEHEEHHGHDGRHGFYVREARELPAITNPSLKAECGSCHVTYHPALLPSRSWEKIMGSLDQHFGEDASLDPKTQKEITSFLIANSADRSGARRSQKILRSIPEGETPLRITKTAYFTRKHHEVSPEVWKRKKIGSPSNCSACHPGAEKGEFSEDLVRIPR